MTQKQGKCIFTYMAKKRDSKELFNCTCLNLRMAARRMTQVYNRAFRPIGLRATQFTLISAIEEEGPVSITVLADKLAMDRTTLTRDLKPLEREGLVKIRQGKDRRIRLLELSDTGRLKRDQGIPIWESLQLGVLDQMGKKKWRNLMRSLDRVSKTTA